MKTIADTTINNMLSPPLFILKYKNNHSLKISFKF